MEPSEDNSNALDPVLQRTLKPHSTPVITAAIDHTSTLLATGSVDGVIKVWDIRRGYVSHTFRGHVGLISALHFFEAVTIEAGTGPSKRRGNVSKRHSDNQTDVEISDELANRSISQFRLASGSEDGKIKIWDLTKQKAISTLDSHVSVVRGLEFSPEQNAIVSASRDKTIIIWDARSWKVRKVVPILESLETVGFLNDGLFIYTGGENGILRIWETDSGREVTKEQIVGDEGNCIMHILHCSSFKSHNTICRATLYIRVRSHS